MKDGVVLYCGRDRGDGKELMGMRYALKIKFGRP